MTKEKLLKQLPRKFRNNPDYSIISTFLVKRKKNYRIFRYLSMGWLALSVLGLLVAIFIRQDTLEIINNATMIIASCILIYSFKRAINDIPDEESLKSILNE